MAKRSIEESTLTALGDVIRRKTGTAGTLTPDGGMLDALETLEDVAYPVADKPETMGQRACLARAAQLRDLEFTPAASLACVGKTYAAGSTVKGVPYSSTRDTDKFIGFNVSLDTFMDAVRNPNSVLYTKQTSGISNAKTWYGMNCSVFVSYCWDLPYHNATAVLPKLDYVEQVEPENMKLCDAPIVYSTSGGSGGHATLITSIERDSDGAIQYVTISHSTTIISGNRFLYPARMTYDYFVSSYINQGYRVYRNKKLYNTIYEPSVYTPQFDEPVVDVEYSDITTDLGSRATLLTSETITLQPIVSDGYTGIKLYRDGVEINSYNVENVVLSDLVAGKYVAKLIPESDNASVSFIVADVGVTQDGIRYIFSGSGGVPQRIVFKDSGNYTLHIVELSEMDIFNGYVDADYTDDNISVVCVPFKNEYGFNVAKIDYVPVTSGLPNEYQRVEYIETAGTQYIDTGVLASDYPENITYDMQCVITGRPGSGKTDYYWGASDGTNRSGYVGLASGTGTTAGVLWAYVGTTGNELATYACGFNSNQHLVFTGSAKNAKTFSATGNGKTFSSTGKTAANGTQPNLNIWLFACNGISDTSGNRRFKGKCYSFSMTYEDGTPIRNFVPCYRVTDGVIGLYDTVEGQFYTNAGTGSFTKGEDVA